MGKRGPKERYTVAQVEAALRASAGIRSIAAKKLGCDNMTVTRYITRHPELEKVAKDIVDEMIDLAEASLIKMIRDGQIAATIFYLKTKGKGRGYSERQEITGYDGGPIVIKIVKFAPEKEDDDEN